MIGTPLHDSVNRPGWTKWGISKGYEIGGSLLPLRELGQWRCRERDDE